MSRYRLALLLILSVAAAALLYTGFVRSTPSTSGMTGSAALIPGDERQPAPQFTGLDGWINSPPLTLSQLRGKVVLVDFWTFSCVNCVRTLPHLAHLQQAYGQKGFVVIGMHSPEFDFEKVAANVEAAVRRLRVTWPVALDSQMNTWNAYGNQYWPAEYLIDQSGRVALIHDGEGDYDVTESAIASLLGVPVVAAPPATVTPDLSLETPELYAGSDRGHLDNQAYGSTGQTVQYPDTGPPPDANAIQVSGSWADEGQYLVSRSSGHIRLRFTATDVYVVAGSESPSGVTAHVLVDGRAVSGAQGGGDLATSTLSITALRLYDVLADQGGTSPHLIDLAVPAGFRLYTFTFG
ncbi:MAG: redoxin family protein [Candidatus Dormibacteria bacterium]